MGLGGPVWHASVASTGVPRGRNPLERQAEEVLAGVGDASRGEWREWTGYALHLRRRLTVEEECHVGPVVDVRGTQEARKRVLALPEAYLRHAPREVLEEEMGIAL